MWQQTKSQITRNEVRYPLPPKNGAKTSDRQANHFFLNPDPPRSWYMIKNKCIHQFKKNLIATQMANYSTLCNVQSDSTLYKLHM